MASLGLALFMSMLISLGLTPLVCGLAIRNGWLKKPAGRDVHTAPVPHMGGLAIVVSFFIVAALFGAFRRPDFLPMSLGASVIVIVGIFDDLLQLSAKTKLLGQIAAALILTIGGVRIEWVTNPFGGMWYAGYWSVPVTVLWVVAVVNTLNLIDGLDGLASGLSLIAAGAMGIIAIHQGEPMVALLCVVLVGANAGFLRYNFNPARIFMGDVGSMFLGYVLASLAAMGAVKDATTLTLGAPVLVLALPIFDTLFAMVRRVRARRPIMSPDRGHVHHRLLDIGFSQKQAVLVLYVVALMFAMTAVVLVLFPAVVGFFLLAIVLVVLGVLAVHFGVLGQRTNVTVSHPMGKDISS